MLYKLHNNIFICYLITLGWMACMLYQRLDIMAAGSLLAFVSQLSLLLYFTKEKRNIYSEKVLFVIVFIYSILIGIVFMTLSYIVDNDTFMFTKVDAMLYYKGSIRAYDIGLFQNMDLIIEKKAFDDWGAYFFDSLLMSIIPNKLFLNFVYMLTGAISSVLLFRIARHYMPDVYSFVGALAYGTSSFIIFFHCTFLKESLFVAIVICAMYNIDRLIHKESKFALVWALFFSGLLFFFRPAVAAFIIISYFVYLAVKNHGSASSLFLYIGVFVVFIIVIQFMINIADRYASSAEVKMEESGNNKAYSGGFNNFVSIFGGFFGPFPTFFSKQGENPSAIQFYASGLTYRLFLILPFFTGIYFIIKNKVLELFPVILFILVEMLATGIVHASLELRKVLPHIPFTYIISFYGISYWQDKGLSRRIPRILIYILAIGLLLLWNVVKKT